MDLSLVLASCLISLVGLPHGALDPMVATRYGLIRDFPSSVWFLTIYSAIVGLVIGFWLLLPSLALVLFLLISSLHFGRDWKYKFRSVVLATAPSCLACRPGHSRAS